jgi:hypothetical protein
LFLENLYLGIHQSVLSPYAALSSAMKLAGKTIDFYRIKAGETKRSCRPQARVSKE